MEYVTISGEDVPALGFGTWQIKGRECAEAVEHALDIGYRHIDTAQAYENEEYVGEALSGADVERDEIFLTTKVWKERLSRADTVRSTEESLRKLKTDYVDLLLIHWPNPDVPLRETLEAMRQLQDDGKVRHIGVSNFTPSLISQARQHAAIFCNQVEYHPGLSQAPLLELARQHDFMLTAYSPLGRGEVLKDEAIERIGERHDKSPAQVALRWLIQQEKVSAIPKAASANHRRSNFDIFDFELSADEMQTIHDIGSDDRLIDPAWAPSWEK